MIENEGDNLVDHKGGCHCGRVQFTVRAPADITVLDCDCSICKMTSYIHFIVPKEQFELHQGADDLGTYTYNTGEAKHHFCTNCGIKSFYYPRSHPHGVSANLRCVDQSTVTSVTTWIFDDANRTIVKPDG